MSVRTLVLTGFGINCDHETCVAFERAGSQAERIHLNDLIAAPERLREFHIIAIPGGFSFGDDIASGKILANRLRYRLGDPIKEFVAGGNLAIGICNGFQVMVKMGLLPFFDGELRQEVTLTHNDSDRFDNRWVNLVRVPATVCVWLDGIESLELPVRHGEGKFVPGSEDVLKRLSDNGQIALRYASLDGSTAEGRFPENPNGSIDDIAAICDSSGRIFGLMPHPEAFLERTHHPRWTREAVPAIGAGQRIFQNAVEYARKALV